MQPIDDFNGVVIDRLARGLKRGFDSSQRHYRVRNNWGVLPIQLPRHELLKRLLLIDQIHIGIEDVHDVKGTMTIGGGLIYSS